MRALVAMTRTRLQQPQMISTCVSDCSCRALGHQGKLQSDNNYNADYQKNIKGKGWAEGGVDTPDMQLAKSSVRGLSVGGRNF